MSEVFSPTSDVSMAVAQVVDARGLLCPLPILRTGQAILACQAGEVIQVFATDPDSQADFPVFCEQLGHQLLRQQSFVESGQTVFEYWLQVGEQAN